MKVEVWKRKLRALGFAGSIESWSDSFGGDLSVEAVPESRQLKPVQVIFKQDDNRTARELLHDFGSCLQSVFEQCQEQVLNA